MHIIPGQQKVGGGAVSHTVRTGHTHTMAQADKNKQPDPPPARRNRTEAVGRDIQATGASAFAKAGFPDPALVLRWKDIVGADVARVARPLKLSEGAAGATLTLMAEP